MLRHNTDYSFMLQHIADMEVAGGNEKLKESL